MVSLDLSVLDAVESAPNEWVVRVDGRWSRFGLLFGTSPRWYFLNEHDNWHSITEYETSEDARWSGESRFDLEPSSLDNEPVTTGEIMHVSHAPQEVQLHMAGLRIDVAESAKLRELDGRQETLDGWSDG